MSSLISQIESALYEALASSIGYELVVTGDVEIARQKLYAVKRSHAPTFDGLSFIISPVPGANVIWILNKRPTNVEEK